jgi:hypothetical protein
MSRKQSKIERFAQDCATSTPEELDLMLDILKGVRGKRQPSKPKVAGKPKPKAVAPAKDDAAAIA